MKAEHFEILVEEPSMESFLSEFFPRFIGNVFTFTIHSHQGKPDLLRKLPSRLRGYAKWLPEAYRIIVIVDRDDDDCSQLKQRLEETAEAAGLRTRNKSGARSWQVLNRIAIEELEAWFFGDWASVVRAYPKSSLTIRSQAAYRNCDAILGGTWEALERELRRYGYFMGGLRKVEAARAIGAHFDHTVCNSPSFIVFRDAMIEAMAEPG